MSLQDKLVFTSADYKILLIVNQKSFPLLTAETIDQDITVEEELIYAIGEEDAIASKTNAIGYKGKLGMQAGEANAICQALGLPTLAKVRAATLSITALTGGFQRVYQNLNITGDSLSIKAKDKQTVQQFAWNATKMTN